MKPALLLSKLSIVTRARDWRLSFVPFIMGCVYLWLWWFRLPFTKEIVWLTLLSLFTTAGFASLGYFINEFFDQRSDALAGKVNKLAHLSPVTQSGIFLVATALTFLPWLWLPATKISWLMISLEIMLFLLYSLPFPRLKETVWLSLPVDSLYAYAVPMALSFYTFRLIAGVREIPIWTVVMTAGVFFIGLRNIIIHLVNDVLKDKRAGHHTLPMALGVQKTHRLILAVAAYEIIFILMWSVLVAINDWIFLFWLIPYAITALMTLRTIGSDRYSVSSDILIINRMYQYLFPFLMLFFASLDNAGWLALLLLHVILLVPFYLVVKVREIIKVNYYRSITFIAVDARNAASLTVNLPLYYFFRIFGVDLVREKKTGWEYLTQKFGKDKQEDVK